MSQLIAISYSSHDLAARAANTLRELDANSKAKLADLVIVNKDAEGNLSLEQGLSRVGKNTLGGALIGGIVGGLYFVPIAGLVLGASAAVLATALKDAGVNDNDMKAMAERVQPNGSALFALIQHGVTPEVAVHAIAEYGGTVLDTPLPEEVEIRLQGIIDRASI